MNTVIVFQPWPSRLEYYNRFWCALKQKTQKYLWSHSANNTQTLFICTAALREQMFFFIRPLWVQKHRACCHVTIMIVMLHAVFLCCAAPGVLSSINNCLYASVDTGTFHELLQLQLRWCIDVVCLVKKCAEYALLCNEFYAKIFRPYDTGVVAARHLDFVIWIWCMVVVDEVKNLTIKCWLRAILCWLSQSTKYCVG